MGWVTPRTWSDGDQVTKGMMADWNNSMACLGDHTAWTTQAAAITGAAVGTGGFASGRKLKVGKLAFYTFSFLFDTAANGASFPSTAVKLALPWPASTAAGAVAAGPAFAYKATVDDTATLTAVIRSSSRASFRVTDSIASTMTGNGGGASIGDNFILAANSRFAGYLIYRTNT